MEHVNGWCFRGIYKGGLWENLTGSAVITHDVTTGTGYCLVGFNWIIVFFFFFELANQTQLYINFEYRKINNHYFSSKSIF